MFSKQEAAQLKQEFWTAFGLYMKPIPSAEGEKVNWINYKTGEKDISFRMDADGKTATIAIQITHKDKGLQQLYYEQFIELKKMLYEALKEEWNWELHSIEETVRIISRIYTTKTEVSVFKKDDWPDLISFFKPRIIALDEFWSSAKYGFEALR